MVCLDTSVIIDILKGDEAIRKIIDSHKESGDFTTTTITEYELLKSKDKLRKEIAEKFIGALEIYSFDSLSARIASKIYEKLRIEGKMINENDILIASIAMANRELLLTRDKNFSSIENENIRII